MFPGTIAIRPVTIWDTASFPAIERSASLRYCEEPGFEARAGGPVIDRATHARWIADGAYLVAEREPGHSVAFLAARACGRDDYVIIELCVRRAYQGRGIERDLLYRLAILLGARGTSGIWLAPQLDLPWHRAIYIGAGFVPVEGRSAPPGVIDKASEDIRHTAEFAPGDELLHLALREYVAPRRDLQSR